MIEISAVQQDHEYDAELVHVGERGDRLTADLFGSGIRRRHPPLARMR